MAQYTDDDGNPNTRDFTVAAEEVKLLTGSGIKTLTKQGSVAFLPQLTGGEPPTEAEFNALLTALKNAGIMAAS